MDELRYNNMINVRKEKTYKIVLRELEFNEQYKNYLLDKIKIGRDMDAVELNELWNTIRTIKLLKALLNESEKI